MNLTLHGRRHQNYPLHQRPPPGEISAVRSGRGCLGGHQL